MIKVLLFSLLLAAVFAHDSGEENHDNLSKKQPHCPHATSNSSVDACSMNCPNGTNCTTCSSDANCTGSQMCCMTGCGMQCVDPQYMIMCGEDGECPGGLTCCEKCCVAECAKPANPAKPAKPANPENKKGKRPEKGKWRKAMHDDK